MSATYTWLPSGARTTTQTSPDFVSQGCNAVHVVLDVTVSSASPSVTVTINGKDTASGKYYLLLSGAAVTTSVTNVYKVGTGLPVTGNVSANDMLPEVFQVVVTANNSNSGTYSVGVNLA